MVVYLGEGWISKGEGPYLARSASDRTEDWAVWYVAGPDGRTNVMTLPKGHPAYGRVLTNRAIAERLASEWNVDRGA